MESTLLFRRNLCHLNSQCLFMIMKSYRSDWGTQDYLHIRADLYATRLNSVSKKGKENLDWPFGKTISSAAALVLFQTIFDFFWGGGLLIYSILRWQLFNNKFIYFVSMTITPIIDEIKFMFQVISYCLRSSCDPSRFFDSCS